MNPEELVCLDNKGGIVQNCCNDNTQRSCFPLENGGTLSRQGRPQIPSPEAPFMRYEEIELGRTVALAGRAFTPLPAVHTVPAVGFLLDSGAGSLVFTGDTGPNDALWQIVNRIDNLKYLIIETAFSNREKQLARVSLHLCPDMLAEELANLQREAEIYITHLKPGQSELMMQEILDAIGELKPRMLQNNQEFAF